MKNHRLKDSRKPQRKSTSLTSFVADSLSSLTKMWQGNTFGLDMLRAAYESWKLETALSSSVHLQ